MGVFLPLASTFTHRPSSMMYRPAVTSTAKRLFSPLVVDAHDIFLLVVWLLFQGPEHCTGTVLVLVITDARRAATKGQTDERTDRGCRPRWMATCRRIKCHRRY